MSDVAIRVRDLSKQYRIGLLRHDTLRDYLSHGIRNLFSGNRNEAGHREDTIWALKGVSFDVKEGEVVGVIGRNGSGKSTLLKILSRITEPTTGYVETKSRIGSLLEVGTGFHPELTGRENIYLNGAVLGMKKGEIDRKFDEIVTFSEIEKFLDTPVKRYSSGMYVRLAFAVAAHMEPEILAVDEVLSVGDAAFQKKCLGKMEGIAGEGRTVLFVSHNLAAVDALCNRALVLCEGNLVFSGTQSEAIASYIASLPRDREQDLSQIKDRKGLGNVRITKIMIEDQFGRRNASFPAGSSIRIVVSYEAKREIRKPRLVISLHDPMKVKIVYFDSDVTGPLPATLPSSGHIVCSTDGINLAPDRYYMNVAFFGGKEIEDHLIDKSFVDILDSDYLGTGKTAGPLLGKVLLRHTWDILP